MKRSLSIPAIAVAAALCLPTIAGAQTRVQYGRITSVQVGTVGDPSAGARGALVGGTIGLATAPSGSNRALRGVTGVAVGRNVAANSSRAPAFEYTILIDGTTTIRVVSDQVGKRIGDCVAVEQGQFVNLRLVADSRCVPQAGATPAKKPAPANVQQATACEQAKEQVLAAATDDEFNVAERRMRLLCGE
jgi:hypothetical protein